MSIDVIGSAASATAGNSTLGLQDFMKILLTQLTYQDPLKPMDNQAFMAQMAQFTALEQSQQVNDKLQLLVGNQAALQSVGLLGRVVDVSTPNGTSTGTVSSLSLRGDAPLITLSLAAGGVLNDVALSQVLAVR